MPMNNVNFPRSEFYFMKFLNKIVSFNLLDIKEIPYSPEFTETPPYHENFEWLQYDTSNFFENLDFITIIIVFMLLR